MDLGSNWKSKHTRESSDDNSLKNDDDSTEGSVTDEVNTLSKDDSANDNTTSNNRDGTTATKAVAGAIILNTSANNGTYTNISPSTLPIPRERENNSSQRERDSLSREKEKDKGGGNETSDEDEVVNYPNQPPIQNGFVVFIHQLNLATTAKEKRTVVEWISDALKMLDIYPETITVDKLIEQSISQISKPKVPVIKFSRPTDENDHSVKSDFVSDNGSGAKPQKPTTKVVQSKKKISRNEKTRSGMVAPGQNSMFPAWKGQRVNTQRSVNSTSSKGLQRKSVRPAKPQVIEDKKQEYGVQLSILREKCRSMQMENSKSVWVLLVESRRRCIVDMAKLNSLASKFRFKVRWIAAQTPRSLDQSVFNVVNDIVQTKNICFPEQMKASRWRDRESKSEGKPQEGKPGKPQTNTKALHVEVLHKTLSTQFDVSSYASFDITKLMAKAGNGTSSSTSLPSAAADPKSEQVTEELPKDENAPTITLQNNANEQKTEKKSSNNDAATEDSNESIATKSTNSSSLFEIQSTSKNYGATYNAVVQLALTSENNINSDNNPFSSPFVKKTDPLNLPYATDASKLDDVQVEKKDLNGNEFRARTEESNSRSIIVVVRDLTKAGIRITNLLKKMLRREGIRSYSMSVTNLLMQPKAVELMENFALSSGVDASRDTTIGCKILIQKGLNFKLAEKRSHVIIVDVEDESFVRMWSIYNYGIKLGYKCLVLEKKADGSFETNLKRVFQIIRHRFNARQLPAAWPSLRQLTTSVSSGQLVYKPKALERLVVPGGTTVNSENAVSVAQSIRNLVKAHKLKLSLQCNRTASNARIVVTEVKGQDQSSKLGSTTDPSIPTKSCASDTIANINNNNNNKTQEEDETKQQTPDSYSWLTFIEDNLEANSSTECSCQSRKDVDPSASDNKNYKGPVLAIEQGESEQKQVAESKSPQDLSNSSDGYENPGISLPTAETGVSEITDDDDESKVAERLYTEALENSDLLFDCIMSQGNEDEDEDCEYEDVSKEQEEEGGESFTNSRNMDISDFSDEESELPTDFFDVKSMAIGQEEEVDTDDDDEDENDNPREKVEQNVRPKKPRGVNKLHKSRNSGADAESNDFSTDDEEMPEGEGCVEKSGGNCNRRKNLLEIHRYKSRDDTAVTASSASEEELFKGWVAYPNRNTTTGNQTEHGCFKRTHSKVSEFFKRVCLCGRKSGSPIHNDPQSHQSSIS